ncbi:MAG: hypothetical protein DRI57_30515 [Deltaproteobacteria bacterium]|nr:MAG: hypothetical protein DRI57_30515 [Deltaproteobacteria bacterium]
MTTTIIFTLDHLHNHLPEPVRAGVGFKMAISEEAWSRMKSLDIKEGIDYDATRTTAKTDDDH